MPRRPNILFLMSDEHRPDVTGYEGDPIVRTPCLDELARTGVVFRNAYCASPICVPGRQAMMAGRFPRHCGCEGFGQDLAPGSMTFARRLAQYGYDAVAAGKLHHTGTDQMQGWTRRIAPDAAVDRRFIAGRVEDPKYPPTPPTYGTGKWTDAREILRAGVGDGPCRRFDRRVIEATIDHIEDRYISPLYDRPGDHVPELLKVSLLQPHYPYFTDEARFEHYLPRVKPFLDEPRFDHPFLGQRHVPVQTARPEGGSVHVDGQVTVRDMQRVTAAYYGMIDQIDSHYASVLDKLRAVGQDPDDWIIIYTSDHGEMLGQHAIWEKQKFFEASARVPLIIRWPRRFEPRVVEENVNLCDLFATLCELADVPLPTPEEVGGELDSRSPVGLMASDEDARERWRREHHNETVSQFGGRNLMIKRDALKYQWYGPTVPEVLFDLARDPTERANLIDDPAYADVLPAFRARRAELRF